ncbi:MAG: hypothetical protein FD165_2196 [Gammaproteobacteria bacterium]|nr:MAG: hypothetical protein FD165_2196 [Gammaproteobacteria bacterium]TND03280.1 MAG: hypothetical protein FD120_1953 [Gammaproteobacteria bacterium]
MPGIPGDQMTDKGASRLFVAGVALLMAVASPVFATEAPSIVQLTAFTPPPLPPPEDSNSVPPTVDPRSYASGAFYPSVSADGSTTAFSSDADLVAGQNPLAIHSIFVMNSDGTGMRQLTHATSGDARYPKLSADGSVVVFESSSDLTGENPPEAINVDTYTTDTPPQLTVTTTYSPQPQIFVMNTDGTGLKQLTHGVGYYALKPDISGDGSVIVFESNRDPLGENTDNTKELFAIRADGTGLKQLTVGSPIPQGAGYYIRDDASRNAVISADGTTVAFDSFQDLTPPLNDDRSDEIFVFDLAGYLTAGGNRADYVVQVTDTDIVAPGHISQEESFQASISADGTRIAFSACINPWGDPANGIPGTNPALADAIFVVKRDGSGLTQLTFGDDKNDDAQWPSISADGSVVIFSSESLAADGVDTGGYQQIFAIRSDGTGLTQLTYADQERNYIKSKVSADGATAFFYTAADLTGSNSDNTAEIFSAKFELPVGVVAQTGGGNTTNTTTVAQTGTDSSSSTTSSQGSSSTTGSSDVASASTGTSPTAITGAFGLLELFFLMIAAGTAGVGIRRRV